MTDSKSSDRLDRIETLLEQFIIASAASSQASNERMTRLEQSQAVSDERMTRVEEGLERIEKIVESNNRFLESFSFDLKRYSDSMNNFVNRTDVIIANSNQHRDETNSRLSAIQRQVNAIARHLGL